MLQEFITCKVRFLNALFCQALDDFGLGGDTSMIGARNPTGILALHTSTTYEDILNSFVKDVTHMQHTSHIWRWNNHGVGLTAIGLAAESLVVKPILIPFVLYFRGIVL
jgi:hypothetical protein